MQSIFWLQFSIAIQKIFSILLTVGECPNIECKGFLINTVSGKKVESNKSVIKINDIFTWC